MPSSRISKRWSITQRHFWPLIALLCLNFCLFYTPTPAQASIGLVADLSEHEIRIDTHFQGRDILLFGAVEPGSDILIAVRGPERGFTVWRKVRVAGMWLNRKPREFEGVPQYYALASNRADRTFFARPDVWSPLGLRSPLPTMTPVPQEQIPYADALRENHQKRGLYRPGIAPVEFIGDTLFKTTLHMPDTLPRGTYTAEIYALSGAQIVAMESLPLRVFKVGIDAFIYDLSHRYPLLYGIAAVLIAIGCGWLAGRIFERFAV